MGRSPGPDVVTIQRDVEASDRGAGSGGLLEDLRQSIGERNTAGVDPDEHDVFAVGFNDLRRHSGDGSTDGRLVHELNDGCRLLPVLGHLRLLHDKKNLPVREDSG